MRLSSVTTTSCQTASMSSFLRTSRSRCSTKYTRESNARDGSGTVPIPLRDKVRAGTSSVKAPNAYTLAARGSFAGGASTFSVLPHFFDGFSRLGTQGQSSPSVSSAATRARFGVFPFFSGNFERGEALLSRSSLTHNLEAAGSGREDFGKRGGNMISLQRTSALTAQFCSGRPASACRPAPNCAEPAEEHSDRFGRHRRRRHERAGP